MSEPQHVYGSELGLSKYLLRQWVRKAEKGNEQVFRGHRCLKLDDEEMRQLRRENEILRQKPNGLEEVITQSALSAITICTQKPKQSMPA